MKIQSIAVVPLLLAAVHFATPSIDSIVLKTFDKKRTANILVSFKTSDARSIRFSAENLTFADRTHRIQYLYDSLKQHADETQANVLEMLSKRRTSHSAVVHQLWITNQVAIMNAEKQLVEELLKMGEVSEVTEEVLIPLQKPIDKVEHPLDYEPKAKEQWGVAAIAAPAVWKTGNKGAGVVIANIDTGVRGTHEALRDGFRKEHGWYDAQAGSAVPVDSDGHGTHTMGTMVGRTNGIGVAPEAQWIACRACTSSCSDTNFIRCGQWALCPTDSKLRNPRCDLAPHAISNSWGIYSNSDWYDAVMSTWVAAGIAPIFAIGNSGPDCRSADSPGDSPLAIGVGATNSKNRLAKFSSTGPTSHGKIKPDIAAPGEKVYSASNSNDRSYTTMSGTSMASPHVAGLTALLYHINRNLTVKDIRDIVNKGAQHVVSRGETCGGIKDTKYPNNHVGHGLINAPASVKLLKAMMECK